MKIALLMTRVAFIGFVATSSAGCELDTSPTAEGGFDRTLAVNGPADLDISSGAGSVQIDSGPATVVRIAAHIRANTWLSSDASDHVKQIEAAPPIEQNGNTIRIGQVRDGDLLQNVSISYELTVPVATRVRSRVGSGAQTIEHLRGPVDVTTGSGRISIEQIDGDVAAMTGSGSIAMAGVRGVVRARTGSGSIHIEGPPLNAWDLLTGSGSITMRAAGETPFDLDARTGSGRIDTSQAVSVTGEDSRRRLRGTVRGGGVQVRLVTGSGGIEIQ